MATDKKQEKKQIITAVDLAKVNNRDEDSLSFVSGGQLQTKEKRNDHKTRIITTSDGKVWVQPANGGSEIDLTQAALSTEQIQNIDSLPEMKDRLHKELELINKRGNNTVKENNIQNQRLDILEGDIKRLDIVENNVKRLDTLENNITNIPTTDIRITNANQNLNLTGNNISNASNTTLSSVLENLVARMIGMRNNFSVLPLTITSSSGSFTVPQSTNPTGFNVATSPGRSRFHRVRHIRMTTGATTHNSTSMVDNTNSTNYFYTPDSPAINNNTTARIWHAVGRVTLSIGTATHSVNVRSFTDNNGNSTPSNRNATLRTTDSWVPTFTQGWTVEYYKESEELIRNYENKLKEIDEIQSKQDEEYNEKLLSDSIYKEYNEIILWFDDYFEKELKLKTWQDNYKPSYDDINKKTYSNWEDLQQIAKSLMERKEKLQPLYDKVMGELLEYHNKTVNHFATICQEIQKERHENLEESAKRHNPNYIGDGQYKDGSCDDWVNEV